MEHILFIWNIHYSYGTYNIHMELTHTYTHTHSVGVQQRRKATDVKYACYLRMLDSRPLLHVLRLLITPRTHSIQNTFYTEHILCRTHSIFHVLRLLNTPRTERELSYGKKDLPVWQKRPTHMAKEAYPYGKRDLPRRHDTFWILALPSTVFPSRGRRERDSEEGGRGADRHGRGVGRETASSLLIGPKRPIHKAKEV